MAVSNVERSLSFFVKALGMQVKMQMGPPEHRETMLGFGADPTQPVIILLSDESGARPRQAVKHAFGFDRLVVRGSDLLAVVARLRAAGFTVSAMRNVAQGYRMAMATDPDGYKLQLVERASPQEMTK